MDGAMMQRWRGLRRRMPWKKIHDQMIGNDNESEDNMTVNMSAYEELRKRILAAGGEELATIKRELAEKLQSQNFRPRNGEDATGAWNLYLDALCDTRLGAVAWDGGKVVAMDAGELDLLADWYECLCEVARSVNRRQKDGRGGCNSDKYKALESFVKDNQAAIEKIMNGNCNRYVSYLLERTQQIGAMRDSGQWRRIEKVDTLRGTYFR